MWGSFLDMSLDYKLESAPPFSREFSEHFDLSLGKSHVGGGTAGWFVGFGVRRGSGCGLWAEWDLGQSPTSQAEPVPASPVSWTLVGLCDRCWYTEITMSRYPPWGSSLMVKSVGTQASTDL